MTEFIVQERKGTVLELTLNRPEVLNSFNTAMAAQLHQVLADLQANKPADIRAVLLRANGKFFTAGGDIQSFQQLVNATPADRDVGFNELIDHVHAVIAAIISLHVPVIAVVQGGATGFGISLLAACDLVIAAHGCVFCSAYMSLGASPDGGASWLLPRLMGLRQARELMLLSERFGTSDALRLGLIDRVADPRSLASKGERLAQQLAAGPSYGYAQLKGLLAQTFDRTLLEQLDAEKAGFLRCMGSADIQEGLQAFVQRRPPRFIGQ